MENNPPRGGGNIRQCHLGKKYEKGKRKGGNVKEKGRKGKKMRKEEVKV